MIVPSIKATYEGKPLSVLNSLIEKRQKWLHETYKQSIVATAINALRSIRSVTMTHAGKRVVHLSDGDVTIIKRNDIHPSFSGRSHTRCFRSGSAGAKNAPKMNLGQHCIQLVPPGERAWQNAAVYTVNLSQKWIDRWPNCRKSFYVVATTQDTVVNYVKNKFDKIAQRHSGLAKTVLRTLIAMISTHIPPAEKAGIHATKIANKFATAIENNSGNNFSLHLESKLAYALDSVKGGMSGIANALKSAANKITGIIKHQAGAKLSEDLPLPFPEVKRR